MKNRFFVLILSSCFLFFLPILHCIGTTTYDLEARRNLSLEEYLQKGFQVIETNIPGKNVAEMLDRAEVILLLETHDDKQRMINLELIQREWKEKDFLLLEEEASSSNLKKLQIDQVIQSRVETWDLVEDDDDEDEKGDVIGRSLSIMSSSLSFLPIHFANLSKQEKTSDDLTSLKKAIDQIYENSGKKPPAIPPLFCEDRKVRFYFTKYLFREAQEIMKEVGFKFGQHVSKNFLERNKSLAKVALEKLEEEASRVWLIAGGNHGRHGDAEQIEAVNWIYSQFKEKKRSYLTLEYREVFGASPTIEEKEGRLNDPNLLFLWYDQSQVKDEKKAEAYMELLKEEYKKLGGNHRSEYLFLLNKLRDFIPYFTDKELDHWDIVTELFVFLEFYFEKLLAWEFEPEFSAQELP